MNPIKKLYAWYGKRAVNGGIVIIGVLLISGIAFSAFRGDTPETPNAESRQVTIASVSELSNTTGGVSAIGSVEAINEAALENERAGRVTRVNVSLGDAVGAGTVIAELENAQERAAVLQAEGSYEAALASAAQSEVSETDASASLQTQRQSGVNTYQSAYTTVNDVIRNLIDELFAQPEQQTPGLRLDASYRANAMNNERVAFQDILDEWSRKTFPGPASEQILPLLAEAADNTQRAISFASTMSTLVSQENPGTFTESQLATYKTRFSSALSNLNATLQGIESARASILNAEKALESAQLAGTGGATSAANAQVKQALGSLRSAQASLEETIIRTPIGGTVNALYVKQGEFATAFSPMAVIANNNALEITAYISASERGRITIGDTVEIEGQITGTVTNIAPAVDPTTKKIEVKIQTEAENLSNGDTVRLSIKAASGTTEITDIIIPITALKVETNRTVVFTVSGDGTLIAHPVETGPLLGNNIIIESGITATMEIVIDARGLNEGDDVTTRFQ